MACELVFRQVQTLCLDSSTASPLQLCWVKGVCVFRCNLPPALLAERLGFFTCHYSNTGVERTMNKSQHIKLTLEKKILLPLLPGFELTTFQSQVQFSYQQAIPAPKMVIKNDLYFARTCALLCSWLKFNTYESTLPTTHATEMLQFVWIFLLPWLTT